MGREVTRLNRLLRRYGLEGGLSAQASQAETAGLFEAATLTRLRFVARMAARERGDGLSDAELGQAARQTLVECRLRRTRPHFLWLAGAGFALLALGTPHGLNALLVCAFAVFLFLSRNHDGHALRTWVVIGALLGALYVVVHLSFANLLGLIMLAVGVWYGSAAVHLKAVAVVAAGALLLAAAVLVAS